jgi:hypothetical protein
MGDRSDYPDLPGELAAAHAEASRLVTPDVIAAAWTAWHSRHGGRLGPGPAFAEAIEAAVVALVRKEVVVIAPKDEGEV